MSTVKADTVQPKDSATDLTLGASGDTVTVAADSINIDKVQDKGGNTLWDYSTGEFVAGNNIFGSPSLKLLSSTSVTGYDSIVFTSLIDATYDEYIWKFIDCNPSSDGSNFQVNFSSDGGNNYNMTKTTTIFQTTHYENNSGAYMGYSTGGDLAQSTAAQEMAAGVGNSADECCAGELHLFAPSSSQFVKHFYSRLQEYCYPDIARECYAAGYVNDPSPINAVHFKFNTGNFDGTIKMYGLL